MNEHNQIYELTDITVYNSTTFKFATNAPIEAGDFTTHMQFVNENTISDYATTFAKVENSLFTVIDSSDSQTPLENVKLQIRSL